MHILPVHRGINSEQCAIDFVVVDKLGQQQVEGNKKRLSQEIKDIEKKLSEIKHELLTRFLCSFKEEGKQEKEESISPFSTFHLAFPLSSSLSSFKDRKAVPSSFLHRSGEQRKQQQDLSNPQTDALRPLRSSVEAKITELENDISVRKSHETCTCCT